MSAILGAFLSFCAAFFKSGKSITTKIAATGTNEYVASWATRGVSIFVFLIGVLILGELHLPTGINFWTSLVINSILLSSSTVIFAKALKISDISIISPLMAMVPVVVAIPSFFILGEVPSLYAGLGLIFVTIGAYVLNLQMKNDGVFEPIKAISKDKGAQYVLIGLIIVALIPSVDKIGIESSTPLLWVLSTHIGCVIIITAYMIIKDIKIQKPVKNNFKILIALGVFNAGIWVFQSYAYTYTQVSYVQGIKRTSILISVSAGMLIFDESYIRNRLLGAAIMLIGVGLIIVGA